MNDAILQKLAATRKDLLDLTGRNRLLNTPRSASKSGRLDIVDERSAEVYRTLVADKKSMTFLPKSEESRSTKSDLQENGETHGNHTKLEFDEDLESGGLASHHTDLNLQTNLFEEVLQKKLLKLYYDARTFEEEQGVNLLYLAIGFLEWIAPNQNKSWHAPLILIPVSLDRQSARNRFKISWTEDDLTTNLSLQAKLQSDCGLKLPNLTYDGEVSVEAYFDQIDALISGQKGWRLDRNGMVLWFFSFSKFLMYRDLTPEGWPKDRPLEEHELLATLLAGGFSGNRLTFGEDQNIDEIIGPSEQVHVVDADSSQALAIEEVRRGADLVIQGPPGTGKSQTITNLIASAVADGKKVLFVAEKMAALDVVKRRLDAVGLGNLALEIHSHKSNKKIVLDDLMQTLELGRPKTDNVARQAVELKECRDRLNRHVDNMHRKVGASDFNPYQIIGRLAKLRALDCPPADFALPTPDRWSGEQYKRMSNFLKELQIHLGSIGPPNTNPWRGCGLEAITPLDVQRLQAKLPGLLQRLASVSEATNRLAFLVGFEKIATLRDSSVVGQWIQRLINAPRMDTKCLTDRIWLEELNKISDLVQRGKIFREESEKVDRLLVETAWQTDVAGARQMLAGWGRSFFRFFHRGYREAQATLRGLLKPDVNLTLDEKISLLDSLMGAQKIRHELDCLDWMERIGPAAFGKNWQGFQSDWELLQSIVTWIRECLDVRVPKTFFQLMASIEDTSELNEKLAEIRKHLKPMLGELNEIFTSLSFDVMAGFGAKDVISIPLNQLCDRIEELNADSSGLSKWTAYVSRYHKLHKALPELADYIDQGRLTVDQILNQFEMGYFEGLYRAACQQYPGLNDFSGISHNQLVAQFRQLDQERIRLTRAEVAATHHQSLPQMTGDVGEIGVVRRESKRKRGHMPLRKLLAEAGNAIQTIKPVFMMSPISVAQFLAPGVLEFDLLVIDEASQVTPVDACGAIARAKQIVVVGDERQLPPTAFFSNMADGSDGDEDGDSAVTSVMESILGMCVAQGIPQKMLRWHYRSKHHSLIAVSNREFYNDRLFVVPSPFTYSPQLGLGFQLIKDGVFDRGGSGTNRNEARTVAEAVICHARTKPDKSLGVGAFSVTQRDAILDELEILRRESPDCEAFFSTSGLEPFFVKNLESIQGDERDCIFISIGYAKDAAGNASMNFGPLGHDGGERRLNVLISRAKERCEVFSSITADYIDLTRAKSQGARALKTFLSYAQTGILQSAPIGGGEHDSDFELEVANAITKAGYAVDAQVGIAGFRIDLSVIDPDSPGRYLLGVECDGACYHSSRSARDRDRIRQQILEDRGWRIHRIWSSDWFHRPGEQIQLMLEAIENARSEAEPSAIANNTDETIHPIERSDCESVQNGSYLPFITKPYVEADFDVHAYCEIRELPLAEMATLVRSIAEVESPIHMDEVARRVTSLWGLGRTGSRIREQVVAAIDFAENANQIEVSDSFVSIPSIVTVPIRNRENVTSNELKKPEYLPPAEIRAAVVALVGSHIGVNQEDAIVEVARMLGFRSTGAKLKEVIYNQIGVLVAGNQLQSRSDKLYPTTT